MNMILNMENGRLDKAGKLFGQLIKGGSIEPIMCPFDATREKQCGQNCPEFPDAALVQPTVPFLWFVLLLFGRSYKTKIVSTRIALCQGMMIIYDNFVFEKKMDCFYGTYNKGDKYYDEIENPNVKG